MMLLLDRLRSRGWTLTPQRRVVAEVLSAEPMHLTADEVHGLAAGRLPEISRATVYKTLGDLVTLGEVGEVILGGRARRYDPNPDATHHHLLCDGCGRTLDVIPDGLDRIALSNAHRHGYALRRVEVVFHGLCPACAAGQK
jgi:Fur family transcriptional regulator, stress-responsive regulator